MFYESAMYVLRSRCSDPRREPQVTVWHWQHAGGRTIGRTRSGVMPVRPDRERLRALLSSRRRSPINGRVNQVRLPGGIRERGRHPRPDQAGSRRSGWLTAERALTAARTSGDPSVIANVPPQRRYPANRRAGRYDLAEDLALAAADQLPNSRPLPDTLVR
jgi:hypothetical protein